MSTMTITPYLPDHDQRRTTIDQPSDRAVGQSAKILTVISIDEDRDAHADEGMHHSLGHHEARPDQTKHHRRLPAAFPWEKASLRVPRVGAVLKYI
jgi:hypothetical protein